MPQKQTKQTTRQRVQQQRNTPNDDERQQRSSMISTQPINQKANQATLLVTK